MRRDPDERPAGVPFVDRGVGLEKVFEENVLCFGDAATLRRKHPMRHGVLELAERAPDRDHARAHRRVVAVAECCGLQVLRLHLEHGDVGLGIAPDQLRTDFAIVREHDVERRACVRVAHVLHDVVVGDDVTPRRIHDEPRAARLRLTAGEVIDHRHHRGQEILDDPDDVLARLRAGYRRRDR